MVVPGNRAILPDMPTVPVKSYDICLAGTEAQYLIDLIPS
jgi:hypothetical protein